MRILSFHSLFLAALVLTSFTVFSQRPNIIYIMADDLGYADLSGYGRKDYSTPNLDRLAGEGIKFLNAYASAPVCTPTRAAFFTGRYPARTPVGLYEPLTRSGSDSLAGLSSSFSSLPRLLKNAGYETDLVGKWHLGVRAEYHPLKHGFDYFYGFLPGAIDYISHSNYFMENGNLISEEGYMTELLEKKADSIIRSSHTSPFFLALMFNAPHWPWQAPGDQPYPDSVQSWRLGGSPAKYAAMVKSLDDAVGLIMKALDESGLADNTVVIFTSDNGGERYSYMADYKGKKMQLWEGGIRVPAFVRWPARIRAGSTTRQVAATIDWTATIISLAGARPDPAFPIDGMDLTGVITEHEKEKERSLYWRTSQHTSHKALREGRWKYLKDEKGEYLFDLESDPAENHDLSKKKKDVFESMKNKYKAWEAEVLTPISFDKSTTGE